MVLEVARPFDCPTDSHTRVERIVSGLLEPENEPRIEADPGEAGTSDPDNPN